MTKKLTTLLIALLAVSGLGAQTLKQKSMDMLYKYMPLADSANYSRDFFSHNVDMSLKAREEMPWGKQVPEKEFLHFVVPLRINNEYLDNHREVFYNELKDRVKGMSMKDAIMEINHWCHEKVTYQPSDSRTHSPLASVSSAIGRCGEESTFGVAALRAMGIPARQVYTPRWAHTDDNHAWVEAWADGKWYFLGACEPEPVLNLGWFNGPASRGMLMHARVFGPYSGKEEILSTADGITDINVTDHYAPVDTIRVKVLDSKGNPVKNAKVSFRVYNYSEFYPIATKTTDSNGNASVVAGLGDLMVWATDGKNFTFDKFHVGKDRNVTLIIDPKKQTELRHVDYDIVPPVPGNISVNVTPEMRAENDRRFAIEDSIRNAYVATFVKAIPGDEISEILAKSRGNHKTIGEFLKKHGNSPKAVALLKSLSDKDLSDVTMDVLEDHIVAENGNLKEDIFSNYVMSPRIAYEQLTPFRSYFTKNIPAKDQKKYRNNPALWTRWVAENIDGSVVWFPEAINMNPAEVWQVRRTSGLSRDIFFVAAARSMGIPARIDPVTGTPQWANADGKWQHAIFDKKASSQANVRHRLTLDYTPSKTVEDPHYYSHFTLSKIVDGEPQLLSYPDFQPWSTSFRNGEDLEPGLYMLTSGQRLADGGVLAHIDFIDLTDNDAHEKLTVRSDNTKIQILGSFNSESKFTPAGAKTEKSILSATGRGYFVVALVKPGHEPSNHALRDIGALKEKLEADGTPIVILTEDEGSLAKEDKEIIDALPNTVTLGYDSTGEIGNALKELAQSNELPVIIVGDTFNRVVFILSGYTIGLGQKLLDTLNRLK